MALEKKTKKMHWRWIFNPEQLTISYDFDLDKL